MTRLEEARERLMDALDAWYEEAKFDYGWRASEGDLIEAYAALKRARNGEVEDDLT